MRYTTLKEVNELKTHIANREERMRAISRRATVIAQTVRTMSPEQLKAVNDEVAELRKEVAEHKKYIRDAKLVIAKFYAPATVA